jgi:hypothetical protein
MRRIFTILAVVLMVGTFAYAQTAPAGQTEKPKATKSMSKAPKPMTVRGSIVKSDATSVTIKTAKAEDTFAIGPDTKITKAGKAITPSDLAAGENATVLYTKTGDQMTATKIAVTAKAAPKAPKTPKEPKK